MLISFAAANHRSIRDRIELSLVSERNPTAEGRRDVAVPHHDARLMPVIALLGPNGAGKSNVLDAVNFACSAVVDSQARWRPDGPPPRVPFKSNDAVSQPSTYEFEFLIDEQVYEYAFTLGPNWVEGERLAVLPTGPRSRTLLFERGADASGQPLLKFGRRLAGPRLAAQAGTRPNSLFLASAAQNNHALLTHVRRWFVDRCRFAGLDDRDARGDYTARRWRNADEAYRARLRAFVSAADLGITDIEVTEVPMPAREVDFVRRLVSAMEPDIEMPDEEKMLRLDTRLVHRGDVSPLALDEESAGTRAWFEWAGPVLDTLDRGALLGADELDAHLNEHLAARIVTMFQAGLASSHAQLIFTAQDPAVVTRAGLGRDQVWIAEKDERGTTDLVAVSDFSSPRRWNVGHAFRNGRYGGVPVIDERHLAAAIGGEGPE